MGIFDFSSLRSREELLFNIDTEPSLAEDGTARLLGWVIHRKHPVSLVLELNGTQIYSPLIEYPRLDVVKRITPAQEQPICGFQLDIPLEMLVGIGAGELGLWAEFGDERKAIWEWSGGEAESDEQKKDALRAHFGKLAGRELVFESCTDKDKNPQLHCVIDLRGLPPIVTPRLSDTLLRLAKTSTKLASLSAVVDEAQEPKSVFKWVKNAFPKKGFETSVVTAAGFPGWKSCVKNGSASDLVLFLDANAWCDYLDFDRLFSDFGSLNQTPVLMPAVYGAGGIHAPKGVHLSDLQNLSSVNGQDLPALCSTQCLGPVWLSSVELLTSLEAELGSDDVGLLVLPPEQRFVYHIDLRQPVTTTCVSENLAQEQPAIQHALDMHVGFSSSAVPKSPVLIAVLGSNWTLESEDFGSGYQTLQLLHDYKAAGYSVEVVVDSDDCTWRYVDGFAAMSISDFSASPAKYSAGVVLACDWRAIRGAHALGYIFSLPVAQLITRFEDPNSEAVAKDEARLARWAYQADTLKIVDSSEVAELLVKQGATEQSMVRALPVINHERFFQLNQKRITRSVAIDLNSVDLWPAEYVDDLLEALAALKTNAPDVQVTLLGLPKEKALSKLFTEAADSVFANPTGIERAGVLRNHELYVYLHGNPEFPRGVFEAFACGIIPLVCARSGATEAINNDNSVFCPLSAISTQLYPTIISALSDEPLRARIYEAGVRAVSELGRKAGTGVPARVAESLRQQVRTRVPAPGRGNRHAALVIPVYGALDALTMCLRSVLSNLPEDWRIIVVNDGSDRATTLWLRELAEQFQEIELVDLEKNAGFVQACHAGFKRVPADYDMVLVNSDVVLTPGVFERLQRAAYSSDRVGLASVLSTNSPHLQVDMNPGSELEATAQQIAAQGKAQYPTIVTPEGQLLYLRRWALDRFGFFDSAYNRGFCEESDLCLRMFLHGVDMVCADDAYMHHRRSASFGEEVRLDLISENRPVFDSRWGRYYSPIYREFLARNPLQKIRQSHAQHRVELPLPQKTLLPENIDESFAKNRRSAKALQVLGDAEVVFILPSIVLGGGTLSVLQHVDELIMRGVKARVISLSRTDILDRPYLSPPISIDYNAIGDLDWSSQKVVATFWTTAYVVQSLCQRHKSLEPYYYVQDYEPWFYSRPDEFDAVGKAEKTYEFGFKGVCKTPFLAEIVKRRHNVDIEVITPGINEYVFYPGDQPEHLGRPRLAAMFRPQTPRRGSKQLVEVLRRLRKRLPELKVNLFGQGDSLPEDLEGYVNLMGKLQPKEVARLYRSSDIVVDLSFWQGFGRMGLEGMSCGAVPVLSDSGGISRYAEDGVNSFVVPGDDLDAAADRIIRLALDRDLRMQMRLAGLKSSAGCREELAVDDWMRILKVGSSKTNKLRGIPDIRALVADEESRNA